MKKLVFCASSKNTLACGRQVKSFVGNAYIGVPYPLRAAEPVRWPGNAPDGFFSAA